MNDKTFKKTGSGKKCSELCWIIVKDEDIQTKDGFSYGTQEVWEIKSNKVSLKFFKHKSTSIRDCTLLILKNGQMEKTDKIQIFKVSDIGTKKNQCKWKLTEENGIYTISLHTQIGDMRLVMDEDSYRYGFKYFVTKKQASIFKYQESEEEFEGKKYVKDEHKEINVKTIIPEQIKKALNYDYIKKDKQIEKEKLEKTTGKFYEKHCKYWGENDIVDFLKAIYIYIINKEEEGNHLGQKVLTGNVTFDISRYVLYNKVKKFWPQLMRDLKKCKKEDVSLFSSLKSIVVDKIVQFEKEIDADYQMFQKMKLAMDEVINNNGFFNYKKHCVLKKKIWNRLKRGNVKIMSSAFAELAECSTHNKSSFSNEKKKSSMNDSILSMSVHSSEKSDDHEEEEDVTPIMAMEKRLCKFDQKSLYDEECCLNHLLILLLHTSKDISSFKDFIDDLDTKFQKCYDFVYILLNAKCKINTKYHQNTSKVLKPFKEFMGEIKTKYNIADFGEEERRIVEEIEKNYVLYHKKSEAKIFIFNIASLIFRSCNYGLKIENISFKYFKEWNNSLIKYVQSNRNEISKEVFEELMAKYYSKKNIKEEEVYFPDLKKQEFVFIGFTRPYSRMDLEIIEFNKRYLDMFKGNKTRLSVKLHISVKKCERITLYNNNHVYNTILSPLLSKYDWFKFGLTHCSVTIRNIKLQWFENELVDLSEVAGTQKGEYRNLIAARATTNDGKDKFLNVNELMETFGKLAKFIVKWNVFNKYIFCGKMLEKIKRNFVGKNGSAYRNCQEFALEILDLLEVNKFSEEIETYFKKSINRFGYHRCVFDPSKYILEKDKLPHIEEFGRFSSLELFYKNNFEKFNNDHDKKKFQKFYEKNKKLFHQKEFKREYYFTKEFYNKFKSAFKQQPENHYDIKKGRIFFQTHVDLDKFVIELHKCANGKKKFIEEYKGLQDLLKSFCRAFYVGFTEYNKNEKEMCDFYVSKNCPFFDNGNGSEN